jgi:acyl carrier protein
LRDQAQRLSATAATEPEDFPLGVSTMSDRSTATKTFTRDELESGVCALLTDMTSDWELDYDEPINGETRLMADLAFSSIDVVQLVVAIEAFVQRRQLHFEHLLMVDGRYVMELQVRQIADFLAEQLAK